ncbi:hypothetical protein [Nannocystis punicea]|uniref:Lipoprotein n=1 Tax=Nannocystis punicea TaxID=2995304 RepID=A0ABY7GTL6_9BACT|nr:hypothetical protein [Nannocystis poenicansa]WAS90260.1 hypothetical protein O0S08_29050 [Nannocystis poenicansa]
MTTASRLISTLLVVGLSLGGCKDDDGTLDSGIDGAKKGDELTDDEKAQFCEAADAYGEKVLSDADFAAAMCTLKAIQDALSADGSVDTCNTLRQGCLANQPDPEPEGECDLGIDWASCQATIGEIEACYEEFGASFAARLRSFSCSKMAEYAETPPNAEIEAGPDCSIARAECPSVMGGG